MLGGESRALFARFGKSEGGNESLDDLEGGGIGFRDLVKKFEARDGRAERASPTNFEQSSRWQIWYPDLPLGPA